MLSCCRTELTLSTSASYETRWTTPPGSIGYCRRNKPSRYINSWCRSWLHCGPNAHENKGTAKVSPGNGGILILMPTNKLTTEILIAAIEGFGSQKARIDSQIAELRAMLPGGLTEPAATPEAAPPTRTVS